MNTNDSGTPSGTPPRSALRPPARRRGVALILAVSFIVLLSALVVGFFTRVNTDMAGAKSYSEGVGVRQLADSVIGLVMGQIRAATTLKNGAWGSQPGMIRVYRTAAGQPGPQANAFYKLYSSHNLVVSGADIQAFNPGSTSPGGTGVEVPLGTGGWMSQPAFFTDVNEPVDIPNPSAGGTATVRRFPIFDPSVARISSLGQNMANNSPDYIEGLEIASTVPATELRDATGVRAPMPVRWMYVLRDGTVTAPNPLGGPASGVAGLRANWSAAGADGTSSGVPTKDNPIVGRIAFWTDDDTCKVNINTAGGHILPPGLNEDSLNYNLTGNPPTVTNAAYYAGSFWDTPRIHTRFDRGISGTPANYRPGLANSQPVRNEFQRYPGHPSTTSLGLVFKNLLQGSGIDSEKLYSLTPRLMPGASQGGTRQLIAYDQQIDPAVYGIDPDPAVLIKKTFIPNYRYGRATPASDADRYSFHLFGSVDELLYASRNEPGSGGRRLAGEVAGMPANSLNARTIDKTRFVLSAHSRAPELNLMGGPRVTIWPVSSPQSEGPLIGLGIRNPTDDLLRFCSTIGRNPRQSIQLNTRQGEFIFDREDPYSSTSDFMRPRNQAIFQYLQAVTSSSRGRIPGWGQSFEDKYRQAPGGRNQILAEIFDYIRSVNLKDTTRDQKIDRNYGRTSTAMPTVAQAQRVKEMSRYAKRGIVVPTRIPGLNISGFGRFPTVSEVSLVFYHGGYIFKPRAGGQEDVEYDFRLLPKPGADPRSTPWGEQNELLGQLIRAFLIVETFNPMQGYGPVSDLNRNNPYNERIIHEITSINGFSIQTRSGTQQLGLGIGKNNTWRSSGSTWAGRNFGGTEGFFHTMQDKTNNVPLPQPYPWPGASATYERAGSQPAFTATNQTHGTTAAYYPFQTPCTTKLQGMRVGMDDTTFNFIGGRMTMTIRYKDNQDPLAKLPPHDELIQTLEIQWPNGQAWPMPITPREEQIPGQAWRADTGGFDPRVTNFNSDQADSKHRWSAWGGMRMPYYLPLRIQWAALHSYAPWAKFDSSGKEVGDDKNYANRFLQILQPGDTIRSMIPGGTTGAASDPRTIHLQQRVTTFSAHPDYNKPGARRAQTLRRGDSGFYFEPLNTVFFPGEERERTTGSLVVGLAPGVRYGGSTGPDLPRTVTAARSDGGLADFDTGLGNFPDGPFAGKADEGNIARSWRDIWGRWNYVEPYFSTWVYDAPGDTYFSPNRQIPSPVMFGSLLAPRAPNWATNGWTTLLFRPTNTSDPTDNHPGFTNNPPDHLWLDLFNMPVVEPYAISEPFSTAGKVNLNYQIMPFGYIKRSTALRAALHPLRVAAIPESFTRPGPNNVTELKYKVQLNNENLRYLVDRDETLEAFDDFFAKFQNNKSDGFFKSASQICERYLYPKGQTYTGSYQFSPGEAQIKEFWRRSKVTGDNLREKPYSDLYSRVTTKSNTYTIHYRVQTLRQRPYTGPAGGDGAYYRTWDESRDQVLSEFRGHTTIERYLDPEDPRFQPNHQPNQERINVETDSLETAYRFRIIYNKRFSPW